MYLNGVVIRFKLNLCEGTSVGKDTSLGYKEHVTFKRKPLHGTTMDGDCISRVVLSV